METRRLDCSVRGTELSHIRIWKHKIYQYILNGIAETFVLTPKDFYQAPTKKSILLGCSLTTNNREKKYFSGTKNLSNLHSRKSTCT